MKHSVKDYYVYHIDMEDGNVLEFRGDFSFSNLTEYTNLR